MKIAISSDGPDFKAKIGHKFGTSRYLIFFDLESGDFEAVPNPGASGQHGAGMQAVVLAVAKNVNLVLTGYCSPMAYCQLKSNGIEVLTGLSGTVGEVVEEYQKHYLDKNKSVELKPRSGGITFDRYTLLHAAKSSAKQFLTLLPILVGVVLLIGLFNTFVSKEFIAGIFSGNPVWDTLWGAIFGSILGGNPINSYVIGGELLKHGISLFAVTAFIITWVTVGLIHLPIESAALGKKFALVRTVLCFILAIPIAIFTAIIMKFITG